MAICNVTTLVEAGKCVCSDTFMAAEFGLLTQILLAYDPMASVDIATLVTNGRAFASVTQNPIQIAILQLLCEISAVAGTGTGGGSDQIKYYTADPNTEAVVPDDQTIGAICLPVDGTGPWFMWNTATLTWV